MRSRAREGTHHGGLEGRLDLLEPEFLEIDMTRKERMTPDILCAPHTESFGRITVEQLGEQVARFRTHVFREPEGVREDLAIHFIRVFVVKRR